ncbi:MAG: hypothetical protein HKO48_03635 [Nitrosopumilus sp.]|nr:hypothetical protein [Nitrosopumilus sp.]NNL37515.1 hypothetical protein [Nitrosopumilus sp.]NNM36189.1 hypothetical protein [Nitrosopumilus sp.]
MKQELCRRCGDELEVNKKCNVCNKENQFYCHRCGYLTEEQLHLQCILISMDSLLLSGNVQK